MLQDNPEEGKHKIRISLEIYSGSYILALDININKMITYCYKLFFNDHQKWYFSSVWFILLFTYLYMNS